jgi:hypothetical protein
MQQLPDKNLLEETMEHFRKEEQYRAMLQAQAGMTNSLLSAAHDMERRINTGMIPPGALVPGSVGKVVPLHPSSYPPGTFTSTKITQGQFGTLETALKQMQASAIMLELLGKVLDEHPDFFDKHPEMFNKLSQVL